jgi:hypothetical protein
MDLLIEAPPSTADDSTRRAKLEESIKSISLKKLRSDAIDAVPVRYDEDYAILIVQINERGKQGKLRAMFHREIKERGKFQQVLNLNERTADTAAATIQRAWRSAISRQKRKTFNRRDQEFILDLNAVKYYQENVVVSLKQNEDRRRQMQTEYFTEFQQSVKEITERYEIHIQESLFLMIDCKSMKRRKSKIISCKAFGNGASKQKRYQANCQNSRPRMYG